MGRTELNRIKEKLKKGTLSVFDIPEEFQNTAQIITLERKLGLREITRCGYDIISNLFFVEENLHDADQKGRILCNWFEKFAAYYNFLEGQIYHNACYTFFDFSEKLIKAYELNLSELNRPALIEKTIDDYPLIPPMEREVFLQGKKLHDQYKFWEGRFNSCVTFEELLSVEKEFFKSELSNSIDSSFFLTQYVLKNHERRQNIAVCLKLVRRGRFFLDLLCFLTMKNDPESSKELLDCYYEYYVEATEEVNQRQKKKIKEFILALEDGKIRWKSKVFYDVNSHLIVEKVSVYNEDYIRPVLEYNKAFSSFEEFLVYRKGDLTDCDFSKAYDLDIDFSNYKTDTSTDIPLNKIENPDNTVQKFYRDGKFHVIQQWSDNTGKVIRTNNHKFDFFFDFVFFLKGNLSDANLIMCDGLSNLKNCDGMNLQNAKLRSSLCKKFGLRHDFYRIQPDITKAFDCVEKNEKETITILQKERNSLAEENTWRQSLPNAEYRYILPRIFYVSDIHLELKVLNAGCQSWEDIIYLTQRIVDDIVTDSHGLLLIGGDVSSDFSLYQLFVRLLSQKRKRVVFVLGNHELWSFPGLPLDEIVEKYRMLLNEYGMTLLHNEVLYKKDGLSFRGEVKRISYEEICQLDEKEIIDQLRIARLVILGGTGFSGCNEEFNADSGIYRRTVDRVTEIEESKKFESLYTRLCPILRRKNTVILTHMPKKDWCRSLEYEQNLVYVSGHTHKNFFFDDGEIRIYSDNQIGYYNENVRVKSFLMDDEYDCFDDYEEGIHEITREQYIDFYRGKNNQMTFQRKDVDKLYMLKKREMYCFICTNKRWNGRMYILNGGTIKGLAQNDVQYYFENMDVMAEAVKSPLDKYSEFQKAIGATVRKIGGWGTIHGCIVDIDGYNHLYVNPFDGTVTPYYAVDMIQKVAYPSIQNLLEKNCPKLFANYCLLHEKEAEAITALTKYPRKPVVYLGTEMYRASREIKKMQKLYTNILSFWDDAVLREKHIKEIDVKTGE